MLALLPVSVAPAEGLVIVRLGGVPSGLEMTALALADAERPAVGSAVVARSMYVPPAIVDIDVTDQLVLALPPAGTARFAAANPPLKPAGSAPARAKFAVPQALLSRLVMVTV